MEFATYLSIGLVCVGVLYWSGINAARKPGTPVTGLFAYREQDATQPGTQARQPAEPSGQWRGSR